GNYSRAIYRDLDTLRSRTEGVDPFIWRIPRKGGIGGPTHRVAVTARKHETEKKKYVILEDADGLELVTLEVAQNTGEDPTELNLWVLTGKMNQPSPAQANSSDAPSNAVALRLARQFEIPEISLNEVVGRTPMHIGTADRNSL